MSRQVVRVGLAGILSLAVLAVGGLGVGLTQVGNRLTVCASGCDFATIQAAVNTASAGDTIQVQAGTYKENVTLQERQNLTLQGAGSDQVTLDGSAGVATQKPALFVEKSQNITVEGFKIVGSRRGVHAVESTGLTLKNSRLENNLRQAILINLTQAQLSDLVVTKTKADLDGENGIGVNIFDSQVIMRNATISESADRGLALQGNNNPTLTMDNATVSNNKFTGVALYGSAQITIRNSTVSNNLEEGIFLTDTARATITNNQITENKKSAGGCCGSGIVARGASRVTIEGNTIARNVEHGIWVGDGAGVQISGNTIQNNGECGIWADGISIMISGSNNTVSSNVKGQLCGAPGKFPKGFGGGK